MEKSYSIRFSLFLSGVMTLANLGMWLSMGPWKDILLMMRGGAILFLLCVCCCLAVFFLLHALPGRSKWLAPVLAGLCCGCFGGALYSLSGILFGVEEPADKMTTHGRLAFFFFQGSKIGAVIYPVVWYFRKLRAARAERLALEHLKVENMIVRIRSLQQQMSPHFLFNCLNVLKSGAKEEWAKEYVLTLSRIYRYLLAIDSQSRLASVAEEVRFIEDYVRVLNHRHKGLMKVCIEAGPDAGERFIPPLALRIVLDHLTGSDVGLLEMPAQVRIFTQADWLIAASDAPPWRSRRKSSRGALGLHNLQQHYQLLGSMPPVVAQEGALFTVKIPLFHDQGAYIGR